MIAECGVLFLVLALVAAMMLAIIPLVGLQRQNMTWINAAKNYVLLQFIFVASSSLLHIARIKSLCSKFNYKQL